MVNNCRASLWYYKKLARSVSHSAYPVLLFKIISFVTIFFMVQIIISKNTVRNNLAGMENSTFWWKPKLSNAEGLYYELVIFLLRIYNQTNVITNLFFRRFMISCAVAGGICNIWKLHICAVVWHYPSPSSNHIPWFTFARLYTCVTHFFI